MSDMRQNGLCFIGKRGTFQNASKIRQKCAEHIGGEHLLDDTDYCHIVFSTVLATVYFEATVP